MGAEEINDDIEPKRTGRKLGVRHIQVFILCLGIMVAYGIRVIMGIAMVAMTDPASKHSFDWSLQTQSVILSSFFWGYVSLQIPSGVMVNRFGGMTLLIFALGVNSVVSLFIPLGAYYGDWQLTCALRFIQGVTQGFVIPSLHHLIGLWVPLDEKSSMGTLIYSASQLGTAIQLIVCGLIAHYWAWSGIFYFNGIVGCLWTVAYFFIGANSPETSTMISEEERHYIQTSLGHVGEHKILKTPWKSICTSVPLLAIIIGTCGFNWGYWTMMTEIPTYMKQVLGVDLKSNGIISALPCLAMYFMAIPIGFASDYVIKKKWLSITAARKVSNSIGSFGPTLALIALAFAPVNIIVAAALLTVGVGLNSGMISGHLLVHLDMAPNFAATTIGITNSLSNLVSILPPLVAGALIKDEKSPLEWRKVFLLSAGVYIMCNVFFVIFASSKRQKWNEPVDDEKEVKC